MWRAIGGLCGCCGRHGDRLLPAAGQVPGRVQARNAGALGGVDADEAGVVDREFSSSAVRLTTGCCRCRGVQNQRFLLQDPGRRPTRRRTKPLGGGAGDGPFLLRPRPRCSAPSRAVSRPGMDSWQIVMVSSLQARKATADSPASSALSATVAQRPPAFSSPRQNGQWITLRPQHSAKPSTSAGWTSTTPVASRTVRASTVSPPPTATWSLRPERGSRFRRRPPAARRSRTGRVPAGRRAPGTRRA